jgi:hypothetical protein
MLSRAALLQRNVPKNQFPLKHLEQQAYANNCSSQALYLCFAQQESGHIDLRLQLPRRGSQSATLKA